MTRTVVVALVTVEMRNVKRSQHFLIAADHYEEFVATYGDIGGLRIEKLNTLHVYTDADLRLSVTGLLRDMQREIGLIKERELPPERLDPLDYKIAAHKRREEAEIKRRKVALIAFKEREEKRKAREERKCPIVKPSRLQPS